MSDLNKTAYKPDTVSAPGETLLEMLDERCISQAELARRLDRPVKTINEIVKGKAMITPETAVQLERALGTSADFWLARESAFRGWQARQKSSEDLKKWVDWLHELPVREMKSFGWIGAAETKEALVDLCLSFFGVANVDAWRETYEKPLAAFRASKSVKQNKGSVAAWLRCGQIESKSVECASFDGDRLRSSLPALRELTCRTDPNEFVPKLTDLCRESGVAVVFARPPRGCPASGAARWIGHGKALVQLSLRYKTNDQLWFTFFHEIGHILLHGKSLVFVDEFSGSKGDALEEEADQFASDILIPPKWVQELQTVKSTRAAVSDLASKIGVDAGVVVGRLQRDGLLPWSHLNDLKTRYEWAAEGAKGSE